MAKKVLILDDNADNLELLGFALKIGDYEIYKAELGSDAEKLFENTRFDLALLDVELPDADGLDLAEKLRTCSPETGLIMLSANDDLNRLEKARKVGAFAYIIKPFNLPEVLKLIKELEKQTAPTGKMRVI